MKSSKSLMLIKEARRYAKNREQGKENLKVAIIGSFSIQYFTMVFRYLLFKENIIVDIYEGEYNSIAMDVLNKKSGLYLFKPDIVIVLPYFTDIKQFPDLLDDEKNVSELLDKTVMYYKNIWKSLGENTGCRVLWANFVIPPEHLLGNIERQCGYSKTCFFQMINKKLVDEKPEFISIIDLDLIAGYIGKYQWFDYPSYFLNKSGFNLTYIDVITKPFVHQIVIETGRIRKCLVLDLDNTLWGGIIGDVGVNGIQIDPGNALGEAYRYFQNYLLELKQRGVILAVCSKNDYELAREPFIKNEDMLIKWKDISCFVANWENKTTNLIQIAKELNIGTDSLVFFDDNPAEREIVRKFLPEVWVVNVPEDPAFYVLQLDQEAPFEWAQITKEDLLRNGSYSENDKRVTMKQQFVDYNEYLAALQMCGSADCLIESNVGRFVQLLNKSNQFNLRTQRYSEGEIYDLLKKTDVRCISVTLKDKFGEYGIISCAILRKNGDICFIESWVMSCRVLKRNVEYFLFKEIIRKSTEMGCRKICGEYIPTSKNSMVSQFYDSLGFICVDDTEGVKKYIFQIAEGFEYQTFINE